MTVDTATMPDGTRYATPKQLAALIADDLEPVHAPRSSAARGAARGSIRRWAIGFAREEAPVSDGPRIPASCVLISSRNGHRALFHSGQTVT